MIRKAETDDAKMICDIYNNYVEKTIITFEEQSISVEEMRDRIREITASFPWLVYEKDGVVVGYAYASKWRSRYAYRYSVESTLYISIDATRRAIGSQLYGELISILRGMNIHCIVGCIALPNPASVAFHERMGFEKVAHFKEVGWKLNQWIDVGYWELIIPKTK